MSRDIDENITKLQWKKFKRRFLSVYLQKKKKKRNVFLTEQLFHINPKNAPDTLRCATRKKKKKEKKSRNSRNTLVTEETERRRLLLVFLHSENLEKLSREHEKWFFSSKTREFIARGMSAYSRALRTKIN